MKGKKQKSITMSFKLEEEIQQYADELNINFSACVNVLLTQAMAQRKTLESFTTIIEEYKEAKTKG